MVLPQPDGPSRHTSFPCSTVSETLSRTVRLPNRLVSPRNATDDTLPPYGLEPMAPDYFPLNFGLRFSMNALRPSI